jgi:hypothetical protein
MNLMKKRKIVFPLTAVIVLLVLCIPSFADTIRLKDGTIIRGQVVGFKDQQFTVLIGTGSTGRRSRIMLYMEDVESIEFEAETASSASSSPVNETNTVRPSTPSTSATTEPRPSVTETRPTPTNTTPPTRTASGTNVPTSQPSTTSSGSSPFYKINVKVRGDNTSNGWTNSGLVVRRGQRLKITSTGRISLGQGNYSSPMGVSALADKTKLLANEPTGALIGVIGDDNDDFIFLGHNREFSSPRDGVLFLGINEGNLNDNTGVYDVTIEAEATSASR